MLKLQNDDKKIKNTSIPNINKYKIIGTSNIVIFATLLAIPYLNINPKTISVDEKKYNLIQQVNHATIKSTCTYEDYLINQCKIKIDEYAPIFNLRKDIVLKIATNNIKNYGVIFVCDKQYDSIDTEVILLCKDILNNQSEYKLEDENIITTDEYIPTLTIREMVYKYADLFNVDRTMALSISCGESGWFEQPIATVKNNPFALRKSEFMVFDNIEEGIIEGIYNLKNNYIDSGLDTYEKMGNVYCPGGEGTWVNFIYGCQYDLENGKLIYDEEKKVLSMENR